MSVIIFGCQSMFCYLAELPHLDCSEKLLGVFDLVHEHVHCCARIEVTPQILYSREANLGSEEPASNFVHRGGARKDRGYDSPCVSFFEPFFCQL